MFCVAYRKAADVIIEIYVMCPGDDLWESNLKKREMDGMIQRYKEQAAYDIEFPNPAEGIDRIYKVTDGEICLQMEPPRPEILDKARKELAGEAERIRCEDAERRIRLTVKRSRDNGSSWEKVWEVDSVGGYPDIAEADGKVYLFYERQEGDEIGELVLAAGVWDRES